jgi:two-component system LytT family response regulator
MSLTSIHIGGRKNVERDEIVYLQSELNYTRVYLENGMMYFVATTLKKIEDRIANEAQFVRLNRAVLVNKKFVRSQIDSTVKMQNNMVFKISRRRIINLN